MANQHAPDNHNPGSSFNFGNPNRLKRGVFRALPIALLGIVILAAYTYHLDSLIRSQFEGKRWSLPAKVYARPLELYPGKTLLMKELLAELKDLDYIRQKNPNVAGSYTVSGASILLDTRPFTFWDGKEASQRVKVNFSGEYVQSIVSLADGLPRSMVRLDPVQIASIYPSHNEDRVLVKLDEVPGHFIEGLIAVEDRDFYNHHGISLRSIARAFIANIRAGHTVQGGSTLTQQLVKNYFLTNKRSLWRKINEALMALLLEYHYSKDQILQAYLNEIYLGQDGRRAIHGIGLASQFYFGRSVKQLSLSQQALLVALVNGPSYFDPRRHPAHAKERRDLVLHVMLDKGYITPDQAQAALASPLEVVEKPSSKVNRYPAFMDLVRRQLQADYREQDLRTEGLRIFTTLDPEVQQAAQQTVSHKLDELEHDYGIAPGTLESAVVVSNTVSGEIEAVVGGRDPQLAGFNRVIDAHRQVGSLIKPVVYLTAMEQKNRYNLATLLNDEPLTVQLANGKSWTAKNYDRISHGKVPLFVALAHSYNQATLQLGMSLGVDSVIANLRKLGVTRPVNIYPSILLGATELSPLDVTKIYQTLANGGFTAPLRTIRAVLDANGHPLQHYELELHQVADPQAVYEVDRNMEVVASEGTAKHLYDILPKNLTLAGKTGTTDDLRDSWFSGFTGDRLAVVWLGRDDNKPAGFTGATGAMRIWGSLFKRIGAQPLQLVPPQGMVNLWVNRDTGAVSEKECKNTVQLPFVKEVADKMHKVGCGKSDDKNWLQELLGK